MKNFNELSKTELKSIENLVRSIKKESKTDNDKANVELYDSESSEFIEGSFTESELETRKENMKNLIKASENVIAVLRKSKKNIIAGINSIKPEKITVSEDEARALALQLNLAQ